MTYYLIGLVFELIKVFGSNESSKDSMHEIVIAYMLCINIPSALTMSTYITLELLNTNDVIDHSSDYDSDREDDGDDSEKDDSEPNTDKDDESEKDTAKDDTGKDTEAENTSK